MARNVSIARSGKAVRSIRRSMVLMAAVAAGSLLASGPARGDVYWTGNGGLGTSWNVAGDWNTAADGTGVAQLPGATDLAIFSANAVTTNQATTLDAPFSILGLVFNNNAGATVSITDATNALTLGTSGIVMNAGAGKVTLAAPITLGGAESWTNNSVNLLSITGNITVGTSNLTIAGSGNTSISGVLGVAGGSGSLTMSGTGTLTLAGVNNYTGGTTLQAGTINFVAGALGTGNVTFTGGTLQYAAGNTADKSALIVNSTGAIAIDTGANNVAFANALAASNTGGLTMLGAGTLTLGVANSYTGTTTLAAGTVNFVSGALSTGNVTFTGGTLQYAAGNIADKSALIVNSTGAISIDAGTNSVTFSNALDVSNTGGLAKVGTGTLTLAATEAYSGATSVTGGELDVTGALGNTAVNVSGGILSLKAAGAVSQNTVTLTGAGQLTETVVNGLSGSTALTLNSGGAVATLSQTNNYTGLNTLTAGTLNFIAGALGSGQITFLAPGGTLQYAAGNALDKSGSIVNSTGAITIDAGTSTVSFSVALAASNTGGLSKVGTGTLTLAATELYTGATSVTGGELDVTGALGNTAVNVSGGKLSLQAAGAVNQNTLTVSGTGTLVETVANAISGGASLAVSGSSVALTVANNYTGTTSVSGGTLSLQIAGAVSQNTLTVSGTGTLAETVDNAIGGTTVLVVSGGTANLTNSNNYSGTTTLSGGTLDINNNNALSGSTLTITSGKLDSTVSGITLANNPMLWNGSFTFLGTTNLNLGTGTVTLNGGNTYTMTAGTLTVGGSVINAGNQLIIAGAGNACFTGVIGNGGGAVTMNGTGVLTLANANTYTGVTNISAAGTISILNPLALGPVANAQVNFTSAGTLTLNGNSIAVTQLTSNNAGSIVQDANATNATITLNGANNTYLGILQDGTGGGKLSIVKNNTIANRTNPTTWTMAGPSTYTGSLSILGGIVSVSSTATISSSSTLIMGGSSQGPVILTLPGGNTTPIAFASSTFNAGTDAIEVTAAFGTGGSLALGAVTRNVGSIVTIGNSNGLQSGPPSGTVTMTATTYGASNVLSGGFYVNSSYNDANWAVSGAGGTITALAEAVNNNLTRRRLA